MTDTQTADPFAGDANPFASIGFEGGSAPTADGNTAPPPVPNPAPIKSAPPDDIDTSGDSAPPLTVTRGPSSAPPSTQQALSDSGGHAADAQSDPFAGNANPFDAIGFEPNASNKRSAAVSPASNPATMPGVLANNPNGDSLLTGTMKNAATTAIRGLSHAPGFVGDLGNFADTLMEAPEYIESKITGQPFADVVAKRNAMAAQSQASSDAFQKGLFGFSIDPRHYLPSGSDVAAPVLKETGAYQPATALGRYGSAAGEAVLGAFGPGGGGLTPTSIIKAAVPNALAGASSQAVGDATGDPLLSSLAGMGASGGYEGVRNAPTRKAAAILSRETADPQAALTTIQHGQANPIPGVQPTTAELTGDPGLYRLQGQVADNNPAPFVTRRTQQDQGRLGALDSLMPGGDPGHVATAFQTLADEIGNRSQAAVDQHLASAQDHAEQLRGQGLPTDAYGSMLRDKIADAEADARAQERQLWSAVDPDNKLSNDTTGIKQAGASIYGDLPAADRAFMSPAETTFSNLIGGFNDIEPFRQVSSLKSNLASAMRQELRDNGRTPAYARMSTLMGPVQDAINGTVTTRVAQDAQAVAHGAMAPEDAMVARVKQWVQNHYANQQSQARLAEDSGYPGGSTASRSPADFSSNRAEGAGNQRPGSASSDSRVSEAAVQPSFDPAAAERLSAANEATKARAETFGAKPVSDVIAEAGGRGNYKTPPSAVPGKLFKKGPGGFEAVDAFRNAVGNDEAAMHVLRDHALDDMRRTAMAPDGTLQPAKLAKWQADHADALRAFPDLADKFRDAATATQTYQDASAQRRDLIKTYEKSVFGKLMNASHPDEVTGIVGTLLKPDKIGVMRRLTDAASRDPMALAGLRQAVLDHVVGRTVADIQTASGPQRAIKAQAFSNLIKSSKPSLEAALGKPATDMLSRISDSLPRVSRAVEAANQKHSDLTRILQAATKPHESVLERMVKLAFVAREVGEHFGGTHEGYLAAGAAAGGMIGKKLIDAIRASGARHVGDLITDAVLNPEQYAALLKQAPLKPDVGTEQTLAHQLKRAAMFGTDAMGRVATHAARRAPQLADRAIRQKREVPHRALGGGLWVSAKAMDHWARHH